MSLTRFAKVAVLSLAAAGFGLPASAEVPNVVATIKPINSLVAAVMQGVGTPYLLVKGGASPHTYSLKPSDAEALQKAGLVFWIGPDIEAFLTAPLQTLAGNATIVELDETPGLIKLPLRTGGLFEGHDHGDDDHDHAATESDHADDHDHDHEHEHEHAEFNPHVWLDPQNAIVMVGEIAKALEKADPEHASTYAANAKGEQERLKALTTRLKTELAPVAGRPYVVFHDAYAYFGNRFDVDAVASITVSPETAPGAARLSEIHDKLKSLNAACVFAEPQFTPRVISVVTEGTSAKSGTLDPLGANIKDGPNLYAELLEDIARSLKACLE